MQNLVLKTTLVLIAFNLFQAQGVLAQDVERITRRIQRLNADIERVRELAVSFKSEKALELVMRAERERNSAVALAREGKFVQANARIGVANRLLEQAAKLLLGRPLRQMRSQVRELLRRADDTVPRSQNKQALRILNKAKQNRDAAERNVAEMKVERAVEHFRVAKTLAEQAIQMASQSPVNAVDKIRDEKRKFEALKERARDAVDRSQNPQALRIFQQAVEISHKAEDALKSGHFETAKRLLNQSVLLLLRALDLASDNQDDLMTRAERALSNLQNLLNTADEAMSQNPGSGAQRLVQRAKRLEREANLALQNGSPNTALWKVDLAGRLLQRVRRLMRGGSGQRFDGRVAQELESGQADLAELESRLGPDAPRDAMVLLRMARFALDKAEQASRAGINRAALEGVLAAQRFMSKAERIATKNEAGGLASAQIEIRLHQLDAAISDVESRMSDVAPQWSVRLIESAKEIRQLAFDSFNSGNLNAANEAVQVSFELLRKSSKNINRDRN